MMKTRTALLVLLLLFACGLFSQDYIYFRDQHRIAAKDIQVNDAEVKYRTYGEDNGQVYSADPDQIDLIVFENGKIRLFQRRSKLSNHYNYKNNLITYHLFDLLVNNFTISYERILNSGKLGFDIPVSFGYSDNNSGFGDMSNTFYTGLNLNFYPTGQGKIRYFMGPGIRIGMGHSKDEYYDGNDYYKYPDSFYGKLLVNNGVVFSPIKALSLSAVLALGIRYFPDAPYNNDVVKTVVAFSFNLSYRF